MKNSHRLTPIEQSWGELLADRQIGSCLDANDLVELAEDKHSIPVSSKLRASQQHVIHCSVCRNRLVDLRRVEQMARVGRFSVFRSLTSLNFFGISQPTKKLPQTTSSVPKQASARFNIPLKLDTSHTNANIPAANSHASLRFGTSPLIGQSEPVSPSAKKTKGSGSYRPLLFGGMAAAGLALTILIVSFGGINSGFNSGPESEGNAINSTSSRNLIGTKQQTFVDHVATPKHEIVLVSPTLETHTVNPRLQWMPVPDCSYYTVDIVEGVANGLASVDSSPTIRTAETSWQLAAGTLTPGKTYSWTVKGYKDAICIAQSTGQFTVVDP